MRINGLRPQAPLRSFGYSQTRRQARHWLASLLIIFSALAIATVTRFDLLGSGSGGVPGVINLMLTLLAAAAICSLGLAPTGARNGRTWGAVLAVLAAAAALLPQLTVAGVLLSPLISLTAFGLLFFLNRSVLTEFTQTQLSGWSFVMPALLLMVLWIYFPAANAFYISLFKDFNYLGNATLVGFENYAIALRDPLFIHSLVNTGWYVLGTVPISIGLGVLVAILLNQPIKGQAFYRLIYFLPYITALTAAAAVWSWIFNPGLGLLNWFLGLENFRWTSNPTGIFTLALAPFGISVKGYAGGPSVALVSIMIMSIWHFLGYNVVIFLAGLQGIAIEYYEAARIDGATWWQQLRYITWPLLAPTTFFVLIISLIGSLNVFTQILIMTPTGGVLNDTLSVVMYLYQKGFRDFDFGYASALAFILFIVTLLLTLLQRRMFSRGDEGANA
jgi:multiple sugar transport system permease protein